MLDKGKPDLVVAFPGGIGTADMVAKARGAGIPVLDIASPRSIAIYQAAQMAYAANQGRPDA